MRAEADIGLSIGSKHGEGRSKARVKGLAPSRWQQLVRYMRAAGKGIPMTQESVSTGERSLTYRRGTTADREQMQAIDAAEYGEMDARPLFALRQYIDLFKRSSIVAVARDRVVGYALVGIEARAGSGAKAAWLIALAVDPDQDQESLRGELLKRALRMCVDARVAEVRINIRPGDGAVASVCRQAGFVMAAVQDDETHDLLVLGGASMRRWVRRHGR